MRFLKLWVVLADFAGYLGEAVWGIVTNRRVQSVLFGLAMLAAIAVNQALNAAFWAVLFTITLLDWLLPTLDITVTSKGSGYTTADMVDLREDGRESKESL